jgi:ribonucleotide monophosphatase NagD (HAD superfamily)
MPLIYEACMNCLAGLGKHSIDKSRILAIGDSLMTDILGAKNFGLKTLFISEGIHRHELAQYAYPNTDGVQMICDMKGVQLDYYMGSLA